MKDLLEDCFVFDIAVCIILEIFVVFILAVDGFTYLSFDLL